MFCSKCGAQTQDGTMFCSSCKTNLDTQYTKPMMNTHFTSETESFTNTPAFVPVKQTKYSNVQKKNKVPLFIGLSIVALIAIITIVFLLLFKKGDDKKINSSSNTVTRTPIETTIETEKVTEEATTEKTITEELENKADPNDAKVVVENFIKDLNSKNYSSAKKYILPAFVQFFEDNNIPADIICEVFASEFSGPNGETLNAEIDFVYANTSEYFEQFLERSLNNGIDLTKQSSYIEPTACATAKVNLTYGEQESYLTLHLVYIEGTYYILGHDSRYMDIDFENASQSNSEATSNNTSEFNFNESLAKNHKTVDMPALGSVKQFNGYTLTIPDRWTILESGCYSADELNTITFSDYKPITPSTKLLVLEEICNAYLKNGVTNMEFGNLIANGKTGYYIEGNYTGSYMCIFFFTNDTDEKLFLTVLVSGHTSVASFDEALGIAASLDIQ